MADLMTDADCLAAAHDGRADAFALIVQRYAGLVYFTARRIVRQDQLAEEVAQATFVALYRKARTSIPPWMLAGWLVNAARLSAKAALRRDQAGET